MARNNALTDAQKAAKKVQQQLRRTLRPISNEVRERNNKRQQERYANATDEQKAKRKLAAAEARKKRRAASFNSTLLLAANLDENDAVVVEHDIGKLDQQCQHCSALMFQGERNSSKKTFYICCSHGVIHEWEQLPDDDISIQYGIRKPEPIPDIINAYLMDTKFCENIRSYNSALAFASMGMGPQINTISKQGPYCFRVHGQIYHRSGPFHANPDDTPQYAQLYFYDSNEATNIRMEHPGNTRCDENVLKSLDEFIRENNILAQSYKMLKDVENEELRKGNETKNIMMSISTEKGLDKRRYNIACSNDIAVVFTDVDGEPPFNRDIKVYLHSTHKTQNISILHNMLDAMIYPIFFPLGEQQWHTKIQTKKRKGTRKSITQMEFYSYKIQVRPYENVLFRGGKLFLQWLCDSYVRMESNRLQYIRLNQVKLRADKYVTIRDYLSSEAAKQNAQVGRSIILPSSFTGSPRNMLQHYQDAMAIVRKKGPPTLFITMTCSPKWKEIVDNLLPNQTASDRPDLVSRVFKLKANELIDDIMKKLIFGEVVALVYVIEFQKRGLPHMHLLVILKNDKYNDPEEIDKIIHAYIPEDSTSKLYHVVTKHMMHGPCGAADLTAPCMVNSKCSKKFPKDLCDETCLQDGFPAYKRPLNGPSVIKKGHVLTNAHVVPYNPYLLLKFNCHINVEACCSVKAVKYIYKYIYKGHDAADIKLTSENVLNHDEILNHVNSRYISAPEATWRIFGFDLQYQSHTIYRLEVHLLGEQIIIFPEGDEDQAFENAENRDTKLTAFFKLNRNITDLGGTHYLYVDVPSYYVFDTSNRVWTKRKLKEYDDSVIGRMYTVNPLDEERYAMRNLLLNVKAASTFEELRTVNGVLCETYKDACIKLGIYEDDLEWDLALQDAAFEQSARQIRNLFALILSHGPPQNPLGLWEKYKDSMLDDYYMMFCDDLVNGLELAVSKGLRDIQDIIILAGKKLSDFNLPMPTMSEPSAIFDLYDIQEEHACFEQLYAQLNILQKKCVDSIIESVNNSNNKQKCFMVDGPAGSGKTFLYKTLLSYVRGQKFGAEPGIALPVASTGIAATLLVGGRTSHSQFGIPMEVLKNTNSRFAPWNPDWERLKMCHIIIWDECTMTNKNVLELVDRLLKDIMGNDLPFGGKVFVLGGDFRQCLPIVRHGNKTSIIESNVKNSKLWKHFKVFKLQANMRAGSDVEFALWLTDLGEAKYNAKINELEDVVEIPDDYIVLNNLTNEIFEGITVATIDNFSNRAILSPLNEDSFTINDSVLNLLDGEEMIYKSADSIVRESSDEEDHFPVEYLNTLTPSGMPLHILRLKKGAIVMLLRNINTKLGLCNGTRLIVRDMKANLIISEVLTGRSRKEVVYIPRINTTSADTDYPFTLKRRQFPLRLAFCMTINKSQGQSLDKVGIYLSKPVFGHGQLYVAFSRATARCNVKVYIENGSKQGHLQEEEDAMFTVNCVYKEVL